MPLERPQDPKPAVHGLVRDRLHLLEEFGRAVRERIRAQAAQGESFDVPQPAPDRRLGEEEQVAAGQVDRLVGRGGVGNRVPSTLQCRP